MAHFVYIIYSPSTAKFYVGETITVQGRLEQHNIGHYHHASTKFAKDWTIYLQIECTNRSEALKLENFIKKMKNKKFYQKLKDNPEVVNDLLVKFRT